MKIKPKKLLQTFIFFLDAPQHTRNRQESLMPNKTEDRLAAKKKTCQGTRSFTILHFYVLLRFLFPGHHLGHKVWVIKEIYLTEQYRALKQCSKPYTWMSLGISITFILVPKWSSWETPTHKMWKITSSRKQDFGPLVFHFIATTNATYITGAHIKSQL